MVKIRIANKTGMGPTLELGEMRVPGVKGGIVVGDGVGAPIELVVGTNTFRLEADSTKPGGVKWVAQIPATKGGLKVTSGTAPPIELVVGANGTVLTADSGEATGVKWAAAGGGGAWEVVADTLIGANVAQVDFASLTGDAETAYKLVLMLVNRSGGTLDYELRFNDDTGANYAWQHMEAESTTIIAATASPVDSIILSDVGTSAGEQPHIFEITIMPEDTTAANQRRTCLFQSYNSGDQEVVNGGGRWLGSGAEITKINILASAANGIGIDSRLLLLKKAN